MHVDDNAMLPIFVTIRTSGLSTAASSQRVSLCSGLAGSLRPVVVVALWCGVGVDAKDAARTAAQSRFRDIHPTICQVSEAQLRNFQRSVSHSLEDSEAAVRCSMHAVVSDPILTYRHLYL